MTLQWVDILVRSTLLGLHVLVQSLRATQSPQPPAVGDFYMTLWQQVVSALGSLLAAEEDAALVVRSRFAESTRHWRNFCPIALVYLYLVPSVQSVVGRGGDRSKRHWGCNLDGTSGRSRSAHRSPPNVRRARLDVSSHCIIAIFLFNCLRLCRCEETLRLFLRVSTGPQLVSAAGADLITLQADLANIKGGEDQLITAWMMSSKIQPVPFASGVAGGDKTSSKRRSIPSKEEPESATAEEDAKSHLPMLLPMCLNLVLAPCNFSSLKEVAVSLIRYGNCQQMCCVFYFTHPIVFFAIPS